MFPFGCPGSPGPGLLWRSYAADAVSVPAAPALS